MRRELTDALIRTLRPPEGRRLEIWDTRCEGLVVRVSDTARVTFHARARGPDGRKRFAGLGTWPTTSIAQARTEARLSIGGMQKGADPTAAKRQARAEHARADAMPSLRELGGAWAKAHARDTGARYRAELLAAVSRGCGGAPRGTRVKVLPQPDLLSRPIDTLTVADIAGVVQAARARGDGEARHLVRALRRLLGFAVALGLLEASPVETWMRKEKGGRRTIPWMRDGIRERVLDDGEVAKIWAATAALELEARTFARLLILSACRVGELAGLAWREIAIEGGPSGQTAYSSLTLPPTRTKNRRAHRVPLGKLAGAALAELAAARGDGTAPLGLVFPGIASRTAAACRTLRRHAGVEGWSWHDCRRSAATAMARLGCPREAVEASLNHISARGGLVGIYQRYDFEVEAGQALLRWQDHVAGLTDAVATLVPLPRRRAAS